MGIPDHTPAPEKPVSQKAKVSTRYGTMDWFKIGKGVQ